MALTFDGKAVAKIRRPGMVFLDSGAHSLFNKVYKKHRTSRYEYFESDEFWDYVDGYAKFVRRYKKGIDFYANVDVIQNPELSWKTQKYLEDEHGLEPIPVVHDGTPIEWLRRYLKEGYDPIAIGGVSIMGTRRQYTRWANSMFDLICNTPNRLPSVRIHGFAMTAYQTVIKYPWWSVDSTSWVQTAAWGSIFVPRFRKGNFDFGHDPFTITTSLDSPLVQKGNNKHYKCCTKLEQSVVQKWLDHIEIPLGDEQTWGVVSEHNARKIANLLFFEELRNWMPEWPWPFKITRSRGFFP